MEARGKLTRIRHPTRLVRGAFSAFSDWLKVGARIREVVNHKSGPGHVGLIVMEAV